MLTPLTDNEKSVIAVDLHYHPSHLWIYLFSLEITLIDLAHIVSFVSPKLINFKTRPKTINQSIIIYIIRILSIPLWLLGRAIASQEVNNTLGVIIISCLGVIAICIPYTVRIIIIFPKLLYLQQRCYLLAILKLHSEKSEYIKKYNDVPEIFVTYWDDESGINQWDV